MPQQTGTWFARYASSLRAIYIVDMRFFVFGLSAALLLAGCLYPESSDPKETVPLRTQPPWVLSPLPGDTTFNPDAGFRWKAVTGASAYRIQLTTDSSYQSVLLDTVTSDTSIALSGLENMRRYFWRVQASQGDDTGSWSEQSFRIFSGLHGFNAFKVGDTWAFEKNDHFSVTGSYTDVTGEVRVVLSSLTSSQESILYAFSFRDSLCTRKSGDGTPDTSCEITVSADTVIFNAALDSVIRPPKRTTPLCLLQTIVGARTYALQEGEMLRAVVVTNPYGSGYDWVQYVEGYGFVRGIAGFTSSDGGRSVSLTLQAFNGVSVPANTWSESFP